jgi:HAD superfamily hydrolase (TIGR01509 family)
MSRWPQLVIFDCDGVLVDSETIALRCARKAFGELGVQLSDERTRDLFLGFSQPAMRATALTVLGVDLPEGFENSLTLRTLAAFERELKPFEGLREALSALGAPVCVASSSPPERIRASLRIVGYADLFGERVYSAKEVPQGKPAPDLFLHAARSLGAPPRGCLVIEDSAPGVVAARRAGMTAFGFTGGAHAQGREYHERLAEAGAVAIFDDMRELPDLIETTRKPSDGQDA